MRKWYGLFLLFGVANSVLATEAKWFVAVYGEHYQHVIGAAATSGVVDEVFLKSEFVGKVMYVRSKKNYELDQFRPQNTATDNREISVSAAEVAVDRITQASEQTKKETLNTEFGPLVDTGLQYTLDGSFNGWHCDKLFVLPMGKNVYRLRCDKDMRHE